MSELLPITITSFILAALSHVFSVRSPDLRGYVRKDRFFFVILVVVMVLFIGLRTRYNDTSTYLHGYNMIKGELAELQRYSRELGDNPGFNFVNWVLVRWGVSPQSFLLFYAAITVTIYLWFIRKYSTHFLLSIFLFVVAGDYLFTLAAIKQCVAVAFALLGVDQYLKGHKGWFVFWVLLGATFHAYALMYLAVPLLTFRPWSWKTYIMLAGFMIAGILLQPMMGTVIDITTLLGEEYTAESFSGSGVNPFRLAVVAVPLVISFVTKRVIAYENDRTRDLMLNLTMVNAAIMYVALFGTANYFARLANYFLIFQCITIPWLFTQFDRVSQKLLTGGAVVCYSAYFYYANAINQNFDAQYSAVTLGQYLSSLF